MTDSTTDAPLPEIVNPPKTPSGDCGAMDCYVTALNLCAASGTSPLCANRNPNAPETINNMLEKLGAQLPPISDEAAKALAITTIYSLDTIRQSFA